MRVRLCDGCPLSNYTVIDGWGEFECGLGYDVQELDLKNNGKVPCSENCELLHILTEKERYVNLWVEDEHV